MDKLKSHISSQVLKGLCFDFLIEHRDLGSLRVVGWSGDPSKAGWGDQPEELNVSTKPTWRCRDESDNVVFVEVSDPGVHLVAAPPTVVIDKTLEIVDQVLDRLGVSYSRFDEKLEEILKEQMDDFDDEEDECDWDPDTLNH
jgi:hypothetical protein